VTGFRNLRDSEHELFPGVNILFGDNAQGKTNFLEAAYLCATGRSQRGSADREMINHASSEAHARVITDDLTYIDVHLQRRGKKNAAINNLPVKRLGDLFGNLLTVSFSPEDLKIIKHGPGERRRFMDMELCQISLIYYGELLSYYRALKQRNNLLRQIKQRQADRDTLFIWNSQLANHGAKIFARRKEFCEHLSEIAGKLHASITNNHESLQVIYKPDIVPGGFEEKLSANTERDITQMSTSAGIHHDDMAFIVNDTNCRVFGSQGQQRTAALSAKLAEMELIKEMKNKNPVLLLDDVLSELDVNRQRFLLGSIGDSQVVMTLTGVEDIRRFAPAGAKIMTVRDGMISAD
jgi:DNA replication and repair protein RecF